MKEITVIQQLYSVCTDQTTTKRIPARQRSIWTAAVAAAVMMILEQNAAARTRICLNLLALVNIQHQEQEEHIQNPHQQKAR
jgi:hypothetical protein